MKFLYTIIYVADVPATLNFYVKAFGCKIRFLHENKQFGELDTGSVLLGFASEFTARNHMGNFAKNHLDNPLPAGFEIAFGTDDVQKAYDHALTSGALAVQPPMKKPWGPVVAYVRDFNGIIVELCSPME